MPLKAICVLQRKAALPHARPVHIQRLHAADAFTAVLAHAYCFTLQDLPRKQRMMEQYLKIVEQVPILSVEFQTGLGHLSDILDALLQAVQSVGSRAV